MNQIDALTQYIQIVSALQSLSSPESREQLRVQIAEPVVKTFRVLTEGFTRDNLARELFLKHVDSAEPEAAAKFAFDMADAFVKERSERA